MFSTLPFLSVRLDFPKIVIECWIPLPIPIHCTDSPPEVGSDTSLAWQLASRMWESCWFEYITYGELPEMVVGVKIANTIFVGGFFCFKIIVRYGKRAKTLYSNIALQAKFFVQIWSV